VAYKIRTNKNS